MNQWFTQFHGSHAVLLHTYCTSLRETTGRLYGDMFNMHMYKEDRAIGLYIYIANTCISRYANHIYACIFLRTSCD